MDDAGIRTAISKVYRDLDEIESNIWYILKEVPTVALNDELRSKVASVCNDFYWTISDCRKEIRTAEDKLGLHPDEEPLDPNSLDPDPRVNFKMMEDWIDEEIRKMHELVMALRNLADKESLKFATAYILVSESAVNILNAFRRIQDEIARIRMILDQTV